MQILQLEKRLQGQFAVRCALEKALGYRSITCDTSVEISMPKVVPLFILWEQIGQLFYLNLIMSYLHGSIYFLFVPSLSVFMICINNNKIVVFFLL